RCNREGLVAWSRLAQAAGAGADALGIPIDEGCMSFGGQTCQGTIGGIIDQLSQLGVGKANRCGLCEVGKCFLNRDPMLKISADGRGDLTHAHCVTKHRLFGCVSPIAARQYETKLMASRCDQPVSAAVL